MRVVIDTCVVISAALRDRDPEKIILWIIRQPDWEWAVSPLIRDEYIAVLERPKFRLSPDQKTTWRELVCESTTLIETELPLEFPRDPKDAKFLSCALAAKADYLITGDRDLEGLRRFSKTVILTVSQFNRLILST